MPILCRLGRTALWHFCFKVWNRIQLKCTYKVPLVQLHTDWHEASTTSLGSLFLLFRCLTHRHSKEHFSLHPVWHPLTSQCASVLVACILPSVSREQRQSPPSALLSSGGCREQGGHLSAFSSDQTSHVSSSSPHKSFPPVLLPALVPCSGCFKGP